MRYRLLVLVVGLLVSSTLAFSQNFVFLGRILEKPAGTPVEFATVLIESSGQWAVTDAQGKFTIKNVHPGKTVVEVSCLGYVSDRKSFTISKDITNYTVSLALDNLALESAVVTAQEKSNTSTTSRMIDRTALDHVQVMNVTDIASLLPGGTTVNNNLTTENQFNIRAQSNEGGNASFGTAVEVDGVRLSNNAAFGEASSTSTGLRGVSTNNIASSNIESVEVITGVPSVEYGDINSGIVKINTRKGKTPLTVTLSTSPNTKQASVSKGFSLGTSGRGASNGVVNASAEYAKSVSNTMSPYTSYDRKQLSLTYSNTFNNGIFASTPLRFSTSFAGNLGGLDNSSDPDKLKDEYTRTRDNSIRANVTADLLLSKPWITNIEFKASVVYSDKLSRNNGFYSGTTSTSVLHQTTEGYLIADRIPPGNWYNLMVTDDKPLTAKVGLKANWSRNFGRLTNKVKLGADWSADKNLGVGQYSEDPATAPTYREYRYCDIPMMNNAAAYLEDNLLINVGRDGQISLIAGVRNDNTIISGSAYGVTSSVSPRFNAKYTVFTSKTHGKGFVRDLSFRASWGEAVKLPSYSILYPNPLYTDVNVFTSTVSSDNIQYRAYYVLPRSIQYNPSLRWQKNRSSEIGMDINLGGARISLVGFYNRTIDAYRLVSTYENFAYTYTPVANVQGVPIPASNRVYSINAQTGAITVSDKTGALSPVTVAGKTIRQYQVNSTEDNDDNPVTRAGVEWVIDFPRIKSINTSFRLDGTYYTYKSVYSDMREYCPTTVTSSDGTPFKYVGVYYGGSSQSNGSITKNLKTNLTVTTNIPRVRMIISMKLEASLLKYSQALSETADGSVRSQVVTDRSNVLSTTNQSIYDGNSYAVLYPQTYYSNTDPTPKNYLEQLKWAKENDKNLYNDLSKLAVTTAYTYTFNPDYISPYFSANFSVTKEIGDIASVSFYANNFFNNMSQVYSTKTGNYSSVSNYIARFYYGLTLRLKIQ